MYINQSKKYNETFNSTINGACSFEEIEVFQVLHWICQTK